MFKKTLRPARTAPVLPHVETLEGRALLSATPVALPQAAATPTTKTTVQVSRHTALFGQDVTATVAVKASKRGGTPAGTVELLEDGTVIQANDGTPITLTLDAKGKASYRFGAGDIALFVGKHTLSAQFTSSTTLPNSTSKAAKVNVAVPKLKKQSDNLQLGAIKAGKGTAVKAGQAATVVYTGFLAGSGQIFDYATANHGAGSPKTFTFTLKATPEQAIQGFDEGVVGMKPGETRVLVIPPALGYGSQANGSIPANSTLVFLVNLVSAK